MTSKCQAESLGRPACPLPAKGRAIKVVLVPPTCEVSLGISEVRELKVRLCIACQATIN